MKIPKVIIQTSKYEFPNCYKEHILHINNGWEYKYFDDETIENFIRDNPIDEFNNALDVFKSFTTVHKTDFFRYYYLYLNGGVFLDYDILLKSSLSDVIGNATFTAVISTRNDCSIFNGFIGCCPKNKLMYEALKKIYFMDKKILNDDYFAICKDLFNILETYKSLINDLFKEPDEIINNSCKLFNEKFIVASTNSNDKHDFNDVDSTLQHLKDHKTKDTYCLSEIYDSNKTIIGEHHFEKKMLPLKQLFDNAKNPKINKCISKTKIGITLSLPNDIGDLFSNGIRQNVFFLGELLLNIGYNAYFIIHNNMPSIKSFLYDDRFKYVPHNKILKEDFDIVISMGYEIEKEILEMLRFMNTKIVSYNCGNSYIIDSEIMLYNQHKDRNNHVLYATNNNSIMYDIIWSIPQMTNTNQYYWSTLLRTKCVEVPFIWSQNAINNHQRATNKTYEELLYVKREKSKKIAIFEPNISIMKWCGPSLIICENAYRTEPACIDKVFINNTNGRTYDGKLNDFNLNAFNVFANNFDLCTDGKLSIEGRFNSLLFMNVYADVVVSHQWENNLNYLYLDLAWMGWPIIHNASFCKDIGYYYDQFNYEEGGKVLLNAIKNHDNNVDDYIKKNRQFIDRYLTTNKDLQNKYIKLINDLYK